MVVVNGNKLDELDFEIASKKQLKGNIYLAKVTRVEPSLQAAFVEYGGNRHGFLAFSEIHPDYYRIPVADREALLAQERDLEEREDTAGADAELGDPRPGRGQRRSFRGEPRGDNAGNSNSPAGHGRSAQADQRREAAETPYADIPGVGEQPPYDTRTTEQPPYQEPLPQPDTSDVPLDWFAPDEPVQENPVQDGPVQENGTASDGDAELDQDGGNDDKPTTYQPANLPRDERSEPYEPSDSDAGQSEVLPFPPILNPRRMTPPSSKRHIPIRPSPSRPHRRPKT